MDKMDRALKSNLENDLNIEIVAVVVLNMYSCPMHDANNHISRNDIRLHWMKYIRNFLGEMNLLKEIKKLEVRRQEGSKELFLTENLNGDINMRRTIYLLPRSTIKQAKGEKQIVHKQMPESLYLGISLVDLYLKWFKGNGPIYFFPGTGKRGKGKRELSYEGAYGSMLGRNKLLNVNLNVRCFTEALLEMYSPRDGIEPDRGEVALIILYLIEGVRFNCLRAPNFLFQLLDPSKNDSMLGKEKKDANYKNVGHPMMDNINTIAINWDKYCKALFNDNDVDFFEESPVCVDLDVKNNYTMYRVLNVALYTNEAAKWEELVFKKNIGLPKRRSTKRESSKRASV